MALHREADHQEGDIIYLRRAGLEQRAVGLFDCQRQGPSSREGRRGAIHSRNYPDAAAAAVPPHEHYPYPREEFRNDRRPRPDNYQQWDYYPHSRRQERRTVHDNRGPLPQRYSQDYLPSLSRNHYETNNLAPWHHHETYPPLRHHHREDIYYRRPQPRYHGYESSRQIYHHRIPAPTPPQLREFYYDFYERTQWDEEQRHRSADETSSTAAHHPSDDDDCNSQKSQKSNEGGDERENDPFSLSRQEQEEQRRALTEFARIKESSETKAFEQDPHAPSKRYLEILNMTEEQRLGELECPLAIPMPPTPPYELRFSHDPSLWEIVEGIYSRSNSEPGHWDAAAESEPLEDQERDAVALDPVSEEANEAVQEEVKREEDAVASLERRVIQIDIGSHSPVDNALSKDDSVCRDGWANSKDSWSPPYPLHSDSNHSALPMDALKYYTSSGSDRSKKLGAVNFKSSSSEDGSCKSSGKYSSKCSSMLPEQVATRRIPPARASHGGPRVSSLSSGPTRSGAFSETARKLIQLTRDCFLPLRTTDEIMESILQEEIFHTVCLACSTAIVVANNCNFVICPACRVVTSVREPREDEKGFVGLGLTQKVYEHYSRESSTELKIS